jgi:4-amino-4-deoxy-L-arabinose transferase-like glycosyltransferase
VAAILRLWRLGGVPPSPDWDEAALGYNAYSIMQTGKDEYGKFLPIILRSFDDYKPALYTYLAIPSIKIFGLNIFAVRLPSAIFGILTVIATYYLVLELFKIKNKKITHYPLPITHCALISAALLAISPWHIQFSRVAFEANVGLAFNILGLLFFLKGLRKAYLLYLSSLFFGLGLYVYQSEKVFIPLFLLVLLVVYRYELLKIRKKIILPVLLLLIIVVPLLWATLTTPNALLRAKGVSVFSDRTEFLKNSTIRLDRDRKAGDFLGLILDNRRLVYFKALTQGYLSHFNFKWLFLSGDNPRSQAPNMGNLYLVSMPFILIGLYRLFFGNYSRKTKLLLFSWFLIVPIPSSITIDVPHSIRTLNFLPTFQIFTAIGILVFIRWLNALQINRTFKFLIVILSFVFLTFNFAYYLNQYFVQQNYFNSKYWQYGYKEAVRYIDKVKKNYEKIIISNEPHLDQSYMFLLYYLHYDPQTYLEEGGTGSGGFAKTHKFSKFVFRPLDWDLEEKTEKILYVGRAEDFHSSANVLKTIDFIDGNPAIKIVQGK